MILLALPFCTNKIGQPIWKGLQMNYTYKRNGAPVFLPGRQCGIRFEPPPTYQYPKRHPCHGCPYTLNATVPSCMFPARQNGTCFRYDLLHKKKPEPRGEQMAAAKKIFDFIEILEAVKRRKGFR